MLYLLYCDAVSLQHQFSLYLVSVCTDTFCILDNHLPGCAVIIDKVCDVLDGTFRGCDMSYRVGDLLIGQ